MMDPMAKTMRGLSSVAKDQESSPRRVGSDTIVDSETLPARQPDSLVGVVLGDKYELVQPLAAGAMGTVYEARHVALQRRFAVKVLSINSAQQAEALTRFKREAEFASALGHENIVDVVDIGKTPDGTWYIVMELLEGVELRELMYRKGTLPLEDVVTISRQLGSAMDAAHARGVVHRDLKPENIFVLDRKDSGLMVKVLDFGISKVKDADIDLTRPGEVIGTPYYMSPEQARGDRTIDHRADLFALGAVYYEALTGTAPFDGRTPNAVLRSILLEDTPDPRLRNPELPEAVCAVLEKALAKDPDDRYQSATQLAEALDRAAHGGEYDITTPIPFPPIERVPPPAAHAATPASAKPGGIKPIHLILAFVLGAFICGGAVWLLLALTS
jgi:serine/threonine-protein kinase